MTNLINLIKKQKLFFILGFIVLILIILKTSLLKPMPVKKQKAPSVTTNKSPLPQKIKPSPQPSVSAKKPLLETEMTKEETRETLKLYPLIESLPIDNNRFHLNYIAPFTLKIKIKNGPEEEIKKEVIGWIASKGVDPKSHQIVIK